MSIAPARGVSGVTAPRGFLAGAAAAGIKPGVARDDLALIVSDRPCRAAGVFTSNQVQAAPVVWSRSVVRAGATVRAVLINSGNANACTGARGHADVRRCAGALAGALELARPGEALIASTGVIGVPLPATRIVAALPELARGIRRGPGAALRCARAIMTTDTRPKQHAVTVRHGRARWTVGGMAKGAGMIHPQMATMIGVLTTDAPLGRGQARRILAAAVARTFNAITVDGDTSTNDCVLLLANGAAGGSVPPGSAAERALAAAIEQVCRRLAEAVAGDGEGARKLITVRVTGSGTGADALRIARTVASSLLVKTAIHGGDPNWGRVMAAAGRAGVPIDPAALALSIGGHVVARGGAPRRAGERAAARHLRGRRVTLDLRVGRGAASAVALGSDLSAEYVAINADYTS